MIHRIILALIAAVALPAVCHALTAEEAFKTAPQSVLPLIDAGTRLDMLDYYNAGVDRAARNTLYGNSRITSLSPQAITVRATAASNVEMVVVPSTKGDTAIVVITTVETPVPDSKVAIYTSGWAPLKFTAPDLDDWLVNKRDRDEVEALLPFLLTSCRFNPPTQTFVFFNNTEQLVGKEVYEPLSLLLRHYIVYGWEPEKNTLTPLGRDAANPFDYAEIPMADR